MIDHRPGQTVATLLHEFIPTQPFETARSRTALAYLRSAQANGRPLAVLGEGWKRGSEHLVQTFLAEMDPAISVLRIPATCTTELEGMQALILSIGFDPRDLTTSDLQKILLDFLSFQSKKKCRTIIVLRDSGEDSPWVHHYITQLLETEAQATVGLMIILMRQTRSAGLADELPLQSLTYRSAKHIALTPFTQAESRKFIRWRIDATDSANIGDVFEFQAITLIHELCDGVPNVIEHLCCASLELADAEDVAPVTTDIVMRASKDLPAPPLTQPRSPQKQITQPQNANIPTLSLPDGPSLVLDYRGKTVRQIPINQQRISIGRAPENDLCIDSPYISRSHATIFKNGAETAIVDLDSKNGTFVNATRIQVQAIADQDEISLGYHTIRFLDPNAPRIRSLNSISRSRPAAAGKMRRELPVREKAKTIRARR
jgi:pSer/pThr/pTyr-binding forkhead associated (FHA) protein/type II secretory pathway predicted ATPase ExeA